ncbi:hypothetical protein [uncultured Alistipes sp.]|uniref:hypothetical protein n=1 Tax=uncultured Alistipes sp. TaxID=538949 RepID=UPI0026369B7D|nr:hypothetical protein [uncultured Alistipes sp.]
MKTEFSLWLCRDGVSKAEPTFGKSGGVAADAFRNCRKPMFAVKWRFAKVDAEAFRRFDCGAAISHPCGQTCGFQAFLRCFFRPDEKLRKIIRKIL